MDPSDIHKIKSPQACAEAGYIWNPGWNACVPVEADMSKPGRRVYRFSGDAPTHIANACAGESGPGLDCYPVKIGNKWTCLCDYTDQAKMGLRAAQATGRNRARMSRFSNIRRR